MVVANVNTTVDKRSDYSESVEKDTREIPKTLTVITLHSDEGHCSAEELKKL